VSPAAYFARQDFLRQRILDLLLDRAPSAAARRRRGRSPLRRHARGAASSTSELDLELREPLLETAELGMRAMFAI
jgi:hypothetical protein